MMINTERMWKSLTDHFCFVQNEDITITKIFPKRLTNLSSFDIHSGFSLTKPKRRRRRTNHLEHEVFISEDILNRIEKFLNGKHYFKDDKLKKATLQIKLKKCCSNLFQSETCPHDFIEVVLASSDVCQLKEALDLINLYICRLSLDNLIRFYTEEKGNLEMTVNFGSLIFDLKNERKNILHNKVELGCTVHDYSMVDEALDDGNNEDILNLHGGVWIKSIEPTGILSKFVDVTKSPSEIIFCITKVNCNETSSVNELQLLWELAVKGALQKVRKGDFFELTLTFQVYNATDTSFVKDKNLILSSSVRERKEINNVNVLTSGIINSHETIGSGCVKTEAYEHFKEKFMEVVEIEFRNRGWEIFGESLWKKHISVFGETCFDNCNCSLSTGMLFENVFNDVIENMIESGKIEEAEIMMRNRSRVGFVDFFIPRHMDEIVLMYNKESPKQLLDKFVTMWKKHSILYGAKCSKSCLCRNVNVDKLSQKSHDISCKVMKGVDKDNKKSQSNINDGIPEKAIDDIDIDDDDSVVKMDKSEKTHSVIQLKPSLKPAYRYCNVTDPNPSVSTTAGYLSKHSSLPCCRTNFEGEIDCDLNMNQDRSKSISFYNEQSNEDSTSNLTSSELTRPRFCVNKIDNESYQCMKPTNADEDEKDILQNDQSQTFVSCFREWNNAPKFRSKRRDEEVFEESHSWVLTSSNTECKYCGSSKRREKMIECEFCKSCHNCGTKYMCTEKSFHEKTLRKKKPPSIDLYHLFFGIYQNALRLAFGMFAVQTLSFEADNNTKNEETERNMTVQQKKSMSAIIYQNSHLKENQYVAPTIQRALEMIQLESRFLNVCLIPSGNEFDDVHKGKTLLFAAVQYSNLVTVHSLLSLGADINVRDASNKRVLDYANDLIFHSRVHKKGNPINEEEQKLIQSMIQIYTEYHRLHKLCCGLRKWFTIKIDVKLRNIELSQDGKDHQSQNTIFCKAIFGNKQDSQTLSNPVPLTGSHEWIELTSLCYRFNSEMEDTYKGKHLLIDLYKGASDNESKNHLKLSSWSEKGERLNQFANEKGNSGVFELASSNFLSSGSVAVNIRKLPYDSKYEKTKLDIYGKDLSELLDKIELFQNKSNLSILGDLKILMCAIHLGNPFLVQRILLLDLRMTRKETYRTEIELCKDLQCIFSGTKEELMYNHIFELLQAIQDKENFMEIYEKGVETCGKNMNVREKPAEEKDTSSESVQLHPCSSTERSNNCSKNLKRKIDEELNIENKKTKLVNEDNDVQASYHAKKCLPILFKPSWMLVFPKQSRCFAFDSPVGCIRGQSCKYAHVHKPRIPSKFVPSEGILSKVYKENFHRHLKNTDFHIRTERSSDGNVWYTSSFRCPISAIIYYAGKNTCSHESNQSVFWFTSVSKAIAAVEGVVIADFFGRNLDVSPYLQYLNEYEEKNKSANNAIPPAHSENLSFKSKMNLIVDAKTINKSSKLQEDCQETSKFSESIGQYCRPFCDKKVSQEDGSITNLEAKIGGGDEGLINTNVQVLPQLGDVLWMFKKRNQGVCDVFKKKGKCMSNECDKVHIFQPKSLPKTPPPAGVVQNLYKTKHKIDVFPKARLTKCENDSVGRLWHTAAFICPVNEIIVCSHGLNGVESSQGIFWYHSEEEAIAALDATILLKFIVGDNIVNKRAENCTNKSSTSNTIGQNENHLESCEKESIRWKRKQKTESGIQNVQLNEKTKTKESTGTSTNRINVKAEEKIVDSLLQSFDQSKAPMSLHGPKFASSGSEAVSICNDNDKNKSFSENLLEEKLPEIENPDWFLLPPKHSACVVFNTPQGCKNGNLCRFTHIYTHKGLVPPSAPDTLTLSNAYLELFKVKILPTHFKKMSSMDHNGKMWYTACFVCPVERVVYHAESSDGVLSKQKIFWYKSETEAKHGAVGIVLSSMQKRYPKLEILSEEKSKMSILSIRQPGSKPRSSCDARPEVNSYSTEETFANKEYDGGLLKFGKFGQYHSFMDGYGGSVGDIKDDKDILHSSAGGSELPLLEEAEWMLCHPNKKTCFSFNKNGTCKLGLRCKYAHVHHSKSDLPLSPPEPGLLSKFYRDRFNTFLLASDRSMTIRTDESNKEWYTAAFRCPVYKTIYYSEGWIGRKNCQGVYWYESELEATMALENVIFHDIKSRC